MICKNCGVEYENGSFCPNCGLNDNAQIVMPNIPAPNPPMFGFGIASMIAGIFAVFMSFACIYGTLPQILWGVLALVFSLIAKSAAKKVNMKNGMANAGFILSIISFAIALLYIILFVLYVIILILANVSY